MRGLNVGTFIMFKGFDNSGLSNSYVVFLKITWLEINLKADVVSFNLSEDTWKVMAMVELPVQTELETWVKVKGLICNLLSIFV